VAPRSDPLVPPGAAGRAAPKPPPPPPRVVWGILLLNSPEPLATRVLRSLLLVGLMALVAVRCAPDRFGVPDTGRPFWRQPGPAATGPIERRRLPDDGFRAERAPPVAGEDRRARG
jgi:hypothetical protein